MRMALKTATVFVLTVITTVTLWTVGEFVGAAQALTAPSGAASSSLTTPGPGTLTVPADAPTALLAAVKDAGYGYAPTTVPVGDSFDVQGGIYFVTAAGFTRCRDFLTFDWECSESDAITSPVVQFDDGRAVFSFLVVPDLSVENVVVCLVMDGASDTRWETCVPSSSPNGAPVVDIFDDGSANYADGYGFGVKEYFGSWEGVAIGEWFTPGNPLAIVYGSSAA